VPSFGHNGCYTIQIQTRLGLVVLKTPGMLGSALNPVMIGLGGVPNPGTLVLTLAKLRRDWAWHCAKHWER